MFDSSATTTAPTPATAPEFRFALRVYWEDTDAGGVVYYANYLKFFERARTEWLRAAGCEQEKLRLESGVAFVVADASVRYLRPARLDDLIDVTLRLHHAGRAQMTLAQQAWRRAEMGNSSTTLLAEATIRVGCVDAGTFTPRRIPTAVSRSLNLLGPVNAIGGLA